MLYIIYNQKIKKCVNNMRNLNSLCFIIGLVCDNLCYSATNKIIHVDSKKSLSYNVSTQRKLRVGIYLDCTLPEVI